MSLAPSEKHLEDWLVANHDSHLSVINALDYCHLIGQQVPVQSGLVDMIFRHDWGFVVVELKRDNANALHLVQILRYLNDLRQLWVNFSLNQRAQGINPAAGEIPDIHGVLIAHSFTDQHLIDVCSYCELETYAYSYTDNQYSFQRQTPSWGRGNLPLLSRHPEIRNSFLEWASEISLKASQ